MKFSPDAPKTDFTVQGQIVSAPQPFVEGHVCTLAEAGVLNQTMIENIRNNSAAKIEGAIAKLKEEQDKLPENERFSAEQLAAAHNRIAQKIIDDYLPDYEFGARRGGGNAQLDPVQREAYAIAERTIRDAIKKAGHKVKDYEARMDALVKTTLEKNPQITADAKIIVAQRTAAAKVVLNLDEAVAGLPVVETENDVGSLEDAAFGAGGQPENSDGTAGAAGQDSV